MCKAQTIDCESAVELQRITLNKLSAKLGPNFDISNDQLVHDNLLKFEVFFQRLSYEYMQETEAYTVGCIKDRKKIEQLHCTLSFDIFCVSNFETCLDKQKRTSCQGS